MVWYLQHWQDCFYPFSFSLWNKVSLWCSEFLLFQYWIDKTYLNNIEPHLMKKHWIPWNKIDLYSNPKVRKYAYLSQEFSRISNLCCRIWSSNCVKFYFEFCIEKKSEGFFGSVCNRFLFPRKSRLITLLGHELDKFYLEYVLWSLCKEFLY